MIALVEKKEVEGEKDKYIITLIKEEDRSVVDTLEVTKVWIDATLLSDSKR